SVTVYSAGSTFRISWTSTFHASITGSATCSEVPTCRPVSTSFWSDRDEGEWMTPPIWLDPDGHPLPTRPCPRCGSAAPIRRHAPSTLRMLGWQPYAVVSVVNWCGHAQDILLVPESREWVGEVLVLGEAR